MASSQPHPNSGARADDTNNEWALATLLEFAGVRSLRHLPNTSYQTIINRLTVDSRDVATGSCFVAIEGTRTDGHRFVQRALDQGAAAVIVQADRCDLHDDRVIAVDDTHDAIARLAATFYGINNLQQTGKLALVGVTGTNGKTTVVSLITSILRAAGLSASSLGTIGLDVSGRKAGATTDVSSGMTTPPPIELCAALAQAARAGARLVAMEVSSHALDQRRTDGLRFDVGVFTNLTQDHLDYHIDMEHYAQAKRRMFDQLDSCAVAVVNADDPRGRFMSSDCAGPVVTFSNTHEKSDVYAGNIRLGAGGTSFDLHLDGDSTTVHSKLIGMHNVSNMLAAVSAAHALGVSLDAICAGIASIDCVPGRLERVECSGRCDVFVDYAHTPDALENVLRVLRDLTRGRLICVFGCGGDRDKTKRAPMGRSVATLTDVGILTSDNPRNEDPDAIIKDVLVGFGSHGGCERLVHIDRRTAIYEAITMAEPNDTVLIAGKGHEDYQIIGDKRLPFDDRQVAREAALQAIEVPA